MTKEQIIIYIEKYIETVPEQERALYKKYHQTAIPLCYIDENPILGLANIVGELKHDVKEKVLKESKGNNFVKRSKFITKLISKNKSREGLYKKAWKQYLTGSNGTIDGGNYICCTGGEGAYCFILKEADLPMMNDEELEIQVLNIQAIVPDISEGYGDFEFDLADIKTNLKLHKAKKDKTPLIITVDGKNHYDAEHFVNVIDGLGGNVKLYLNQVLNKSTNAVFKSENGVAVLCPIVNVNNRQVIDYSKNN